MLKLYSNLKTSNKITFLFTVFNLLESRQLHILEQNLIEANILQGDKIVILENKKDIDGKLSGKIYDSISYLVNNHGIKYIENIFRNIIKEIREEDKKQWIKYNQENSDIKIRDISEYRGVTSWKLIDKLTTKLKVERYYENKNKINAELYFGMDYNERFFH